MIYRLKHILPLLALCALLPACSDYDVFDDPSIGRKTPIELSVGDDASLSTRAVIIDGKGKITAFEKDTRLHLLMISEDASSTDRTKDKYTETYGMAKGSGKNPSQLDPDVSKWADKEKESVVSFESGKGVYRYWDDAHGRTSKLSVYGFANVWAINPTGAPWYPKLDRIEDNANSGTETQSFPAVWKSNPDEKIGTMVGATAGKWIVGDYTPKANKNYTEQTKTSVLEKDDICYSNNLANYSTSDSDKDKDKRLYFDDSDNTNKHFTGGVMVFHRAMCLFTFKVYMGSGFSESNFTFKDGTNIAMKGFNKKGYLNIKTGEWSAIEVGSDATYEGVSGYSWSKIDLTNENGNLETDNGNNGKYWQLLAFAIPGTDISNSSVTDALTMNINGNLYKVSMKQLYDAIAANSVNCESGTANGAVLEEYLTDHTKLKAGINYEFSMTISKTAIDNITAKIIDWETVSASNFDPSNAPIKLSVEGDRGTARGGVDFYRANDDASSFNDYAGYRWETGYTESGNFSASTFADGKFTLNEKWYWDSNLTYYHFRTVPAGQKVTAGSSAADDSAEDKSDYITLKASTSSTSTDYTDVTWGAPFKDLAEPPSKEKFIYNPDTGFDVNRGDNNPHQIYKAIGPTKDQIVIVPIHMMSEIEIKLLTSNQDNKVDLSSATVNLIGAYSTGKVLMGNGKVIPTGDPSTSTNPVALPYNLAATADADKKQFGVIPQSLENVQLEIITADNNRYVVDLKDIVVSTAPETKEIENPYTADANGKYHIDRWYPNFKYKYTFQLVKTQINNFMVTIVDWETVTAADETVQIK